MRGQNLFAANYDWRVVPGPSDEVFDGVISGLSAASLTDNVYEYGVDYLGYFLKRAMDQWQIAHPGDTLKEVDIIAHSTGGLVARSYIQSAAYGGLLPDGRRLPKVGELVMVGVPNQGAAKPWNPLHDDWTVDPSFQYLLSKLINLAFQKVLDGAVVTGTDGDIDAASLQPPTCDDEMKRCFIRRYVPTIQSLLATYSFLMQGNGLEDVNSNPDLRNSLVLDLNAGLGLQVNGDPNSFADSTRVTVMYGTSVTTPTAVEERLGAEDGASFDEFAARDAQPGEHWYEDIFLASHGDGTVPLQSSVGQFQGDPRVRRVAWAQGGNSSFGVDHCGLMSNADVQDSILTILGVRPVGGAGHAAADRAGRGSLRPGERRRWQGTERAGEHRALGDGRAARPGRALPAAGFSAGGNCLERSGPGATQLDARGRRDDLHCAGRSHGGRTLDAAADDRRHLDNADDPER